VAVGASVGASVAAGASVAVGASVAGAVVAVAPQAVSNMEAKTNRLVSEYNTLFLFISQSPFDDGERI